MKFIQDPDLTDTSTAKLADFTLTIHNNNFNMSGGEGGKIA